MKKSLQKLGGVRLRATRRAAQGPSLAGATQDDGCSLA
jgi:hypothetical protein